MNPEGVPLYWVGYGGFPAQPGGPRVNQNTTVTIIPDPPTDDIVWSLCNFVYNNPFCLGLGALIYSIRSRDRRMVGDPEGARRYASTARRFNIAALIVAVICYAIFISLYVFLRFYHFPQIHRKRYG